MKKILYFIAVGAVGITASLSGCHTEMDLKEPVPNLPATPYQYNSTTNMFNMPSTNISTNAGIALGRVLFYDPRLSINNSVSCASCHKQSLAFADNAAFSTGFGAKKTTRNTPGIFNAGSKAEFFWDGRVTSLEEQTLQPVQNHLEMGLEKLDVLEQKLKATSFYADLFQKAFGSSEITSEKVARALAQFTRAIVSQQSKIDMGQGMLTVDEQKGLEIFVQHRCNECHKGSDFGGSSIIDPYMGDATIVPNSANIGLDVSYKDGGLAELGGSNAAVLNGFFMIPSLRNVALTAPYMHDGRFKTLEEVVEHYNSGIQAHPQLDPVLKDANGYPKRMNLSNKEKQQLVAFLHTLTDAQMVTDVRYANPFK